MTTKTGPQRYPGASRANWYQDDYPGDPMQVNVVVLHTTEGRSLPDVQRWFDRAQPDGGAGPRREEAEVVPALRHRDLVPGPRQQAGRRRDEHAQRHARSNWSAPATPRRTRSGRPRARRTSTGRRPPTGRCSRSRGSWPGCTRSTAWRWPARRRGRRTRPRTPTVAASGCPSREWKAFKGVCGHMHVPENDHGDPGAIDFSAIVKYAKAELDLVDDTPRQTTPRRRPSPSRRCPRSRAASTSGRGPRTRHVLQLGKQLVKRGFGDHYKVGPSRTWGEADRLNVRDFQKSRKELRGDADGSPGPLTWRLLFS